MGDGPGRQKQRIIVLFKFAFLDGVNSQVSMFDNITRRTDKINLNGGNPHISNGLLVPRNDQIIDYSLLCY